MMLNNIFTEQDIAVRCQVTILFCRILPYSCIFIFTTYTINVSTKLLTCKAWLIKIIFYQQFSYEILPDLVCCTINYKKNCRQSMPNAVSRKEIKISVKYGVMACVIFSVMDKRKVNKAQSKSKKINKKTIHCQRLKVK